MRRLDKTHNAAAAESFLLMSRMALYSLTLIIPRFSEKVKGNFRLFFLFFISILPERFSAENTGFQRLAQKKSCEDGGESTI